MKVPVINRQNYHVYLEAHAGILWVHCDVLKFSADVLKDMDKTWKDLVNLLQSDLYVLHDQKINQPSKHFISRYGFYKYKDIVDKNGNPKEIWKRDKSWAV